MTSPHSKPFISRPPHHTADLAGQLVFLGTGTSVGVPVVGCDCDTCRSDDHRNWRTRCSIVLGLPEGNLLIDATPDMRTQLLRERIGRIHATVLTHDHADHIFGMDDLRVFPHYLQRSMPVYCEEHVEARIRKSFDYAFAPGANLLGGGVPQLEFIPIGQTGFTVLGQAIRPFRLRHGQFKVLGFRFGNIAYCTDTNGIPDESWPMLAGLDVLILDALRPRPHPTHFSLEEALEVVRRVKPRRTLLTHLSHEIEHAWALENLPVGVEPAYDGLRIPLM